MTSIQRSGTASVAGLAGLVLTFGLVQAAAPEWANSTGLDVWNLSALAERVKATELQEETLATQMDQLRSEMEFAEHTSHRLANYSLSLAGATDLMEPILRQRSGFECVVIHFYRAPTFRLAVAQNMIMRCLQRCHRMDLIDWSIMTARLGLEYSLMQ